MYRFISRFLTISMFLLLFSGVVRAVAAPKDMNEYENRLAYQLEDLSLQGYADGSFQSSMDNALSDQLPFASYFKKIYNLVDSAYTLSLAVPISERLTDHYLACKNIKLFNGYLCYGLKPAEDYAAAVEKNAGIFNQAVANNPDTKFFIYPIENEEHLNFETSEKSSVTDQILQSFSCPDENKAAFVINDFEQYSELFFRSDHHWNHKGSYLGYCQVLKLLRPDEEPVSVNETVKVSGRFTGLKALFSGLDSFTEDFYANIYTLPQFSYQEYRQNVDRINMRSEFLSGEAGKDISYGFFYGGDLPETIISSGAEQGENILIIGDSYDNAILELLASHYKNLYAVDLRYYYLLNSGSFNISSYIAENAIDTVLVIGSAAEVFGSESFDLGA